MAVGIQGCDSGASAVPLEDLRERTIEASCAFYFDCCSEAGRDGRVPSDVTTAEQCVAYRTASEWDVEAEVMASVAAGRHRYDAEAAGACLAMLRSCATDTCMFSIGAVENGSACTRSDECVSGFCSADGVCAPRLGAGEACTIADVCDAGLSCRDGLCAERADDGAACATSGDCESGNCSATGICAARVICR